MVPGSRRKYFLKEKLSWKNEQIFKIHISEGSGVKPPLSEKIFHRVLHFIVLRFVAKGAMRDFEFWG